MRSDEHSNFNVDDESLWGKMKGGDRPALATLFRRHYAMLFDYAVKLTGQQELAKDSIQEVFVYLWEKRVAVSPAHSVKAYLLVMLRREALKRLRKNHLRDQSNGVFKSEMAPEAFSPEDMVIMQEQQEAEKRALANALNSIPPRLREAIYLKTYDDLRYREIAAIMEVSPQVARNYISEAYHRLRKIVKKTSILS